MDYQILIKEGNKKPYQLVKAYSFSETVYIAAIVFIKMLSRNYKTLAEYQEEEDGNWALIKPHDD